MAAQAAAQPNSGGNQHHVEQYGCKRGYAEAAVGIEDPASKRGKRHEKQVRKRKAQHERREIEVAAIADEARRNDQNKQRRTDYAKQGYDEQDNAKRPSHGIEVVARLGAIVLLLVTGHNRHEAGRKGPFSEEPPQHVGYALGHQEGVHEQAGTKKPRKHDIPHQPENSGQQRHTADDRRL